ncbi:hypothetical protein [Nonomuraea sp. NPDC050202]|uniref:hypothetical protein n=1 Tax=Nonomuraea sp. NPDC050202 TaxID=3155035 RepID=UPI0033E699FF
MIDPWSAQIFDLAIQLMEADPGLHPSAAMEQAACNEGSPVPAGVDALPLLEVATDELLIRHADMYGHDEPLDLMNLVRDEAIPAARATAESIRSYFKETR